MPKLKICQDCGKEFPQYQMIDNKRVDFHGRIRCFTCFPYKDRKIKLSQTCLKCHKIFRINTTENGKLKSLSGRKFCLDCHPFVERTNQHHEFKDLSLNYRIERAHSKSGSYSKIHISGKSRVEKWGDFLYKNHKIHGLGLHRKYDRYLYIKSKCNTRRYEKTINNLFIV